MLVLTAHAARKAGVSVEKRLDRSIGLRSIDADLVKQAFLNLVLNAVQAMPGGGVLA
ncbi:MAG TPA: two-component sensor histidine kinase, partial [Nitrospiraceae bacterium]|nr:two-component sensor histidine kinase [Nitrospiraceae bacterium]